MIQNLKQGAKRVAKAITRDRRSWMPPDWNETDAHALKALHLGMANDWQQKRALKWIIENACGTYDMSFRPGGQEGDRDTSFALGRQFVGQQIVKLLKINLSVLRRNDADT